MMDDPPPPMSISVFYPHNHISPKTVRIFGDWLIERFAKA